MTTPAVTLRSSPVTAAESSEARYAQAAATSAASTIRPSGDALGERGAGLLLGDPADGGLPADHLLDPRAGHGAGADRVDPDVVRPEFGGQRADQPDHAHLGRGVGGAAVQRVLAGHGRDRDQAAAAALDHPGDERAERQEHTVEIDGDGVAPVRQRHLVQRPRRPGHAGVGDDRVHGPERLRLGRHLRHRRLVPHVAGERDRRPARLPGLRDRVVQAGRVPGAGRDREPARGQGHRDRAPDAPVGPGDDRDRGAHPVFPAARRADRMRSGVIGSSASATVAGAA